MSNQSLLKAWRTRWNRNLMRFLRGRAHPANIEDIAQETYLRLLRAPDLNDVRNPQAYLLRTASHIASEWSQESGADAPSVSTEDETLVDLCTPEFEVDAAWAQDRLMALLTTLPPAMRAALVLRLRDDLPYKEIARQLQITERQARRYLENGYDLLRAALEG
jgi:RNA polymerase sigma-70 factor (ECF subfamily)